ncbi:MAG: hypothetical protein ACFB4I_24790 [Cyanophyceae cyanobacterium]
MMFLSATRFRLRSPLFLPLVWWHGHWSTQQLRQTNGFLGGKTLQDVHWAFWSVTA